MSRAGAFMIAGLVLSLPAALVPPHAPWAVAMLGIGIILARRKWLEAHTLVAVQGTCPRCEAEVSGSGGRLRAPHPLHCEGCHHQVSLVVDLDRS